jgi:magnesium and cobalt exporter, CNNM family
MNVALGLIVAVAAIALFTIVNAVEIAIVGANRIRIHHLAEMGSRTAQAAQRLQSRQDRFFAAIVLVQNLAVVLAAEMGALIGRELAGTPGIVAATLIVPVVAALFGELTPKVLAAQASEKFVLAVALPTEALTRILGPLVAVLGWFPGLLSRALYGVRLEAGPSVSEAELRMLIGISAESGSVEEEEAELLDRVFHFGDRRVHEVMVPRNEVVWLEHGSTVADFFEVFATASHSRFPVFEDHHDNVIGIVGIKDVLRGLATGDLTPASEVEAVMRPAEYIPETKLVRELFREMQAKGAQMAIAVDEHGGTAGIVTLESLLEEMVGAVRDEAGVEEDEIRPIDETNVQIDGGVSVSEAREELGVDIPDGPYDTVAGFVLHELGHIPEEGEVVPLDGGRITVLEVKGPKVELLQFTRGAEAQSSS